MSRTAFGPVLRNELRLVKADPLVVVLLMFMPLVIISILKSTMGASLMASGQSDVTGAEQVVPGQALLFGFFLTSFIGLTFFREHGWGTWDRLRVSRATRFDIIVAKTLPWVVVGLTQLIALFFLGWLLFDLNVDGANDAVGILIVSVCWSIFVGCFAVAMVALLPSIQLVSAVSNLGAMVFSAIGGALVPSAQLPGWARALGPFIPTHWAMRGFDAIFLDGEGVAGVIGPCVILLAFAVGFGILAHTRFKFDAVKTSWA